MMLTTNKYSPRAIARPFGSGWWTERRNTTLLRIMRDYNDIGKASRVLGCPVGAVERQLRFLKHVMKAIPKGFNDNE